MGEHKRKSGTAPFKINIDWGKVDPAHVPPGIEEFWICRSVPGVTFAVQHIPIDGWRAGMHLPGATQLAYVDEEGNLFNPHAEYHTPFASREDAMAAVKTFIRKKMEHAAKEASK